MEQQKNTTSGFAVNTRMQDFTLSVRDLQLLKNIIELTTERGAFRAEELYDVGDVYRRLNGFLEHTKKVAQQDQQQGESND